MVTANNGFTQRVSAMLQRHGRIVSTSVVTTGEDMDAAITAADPDLILCPYLTARIPTRIYSTRSCLIFHPGPVGDRGPSSLDWAIINEDPVWGVTVLEAGEEMDGGAVWASRTFILPVQRKSDAYNGIIASAGLQCLLEAADRALDPEFVPTAQDRAHRPVAHASERPLMTQTDRAFDWAEHADVVLRHIRSGDGFPGVRSTLAELPVYLYDAHPSHREQQSGQPGDIIGRHHHGVEVACGESSSVWIGHLRARIGDTMSCKAPASAVLAAAGIRLAATPPTLDPAWTDMRYERCGAVGTITVEAYNGALSTDMCLRLAELIRFASRQDTRVLVLRSRGSFFLTGIHLGQIEIVERPHDEAWHNICAINDVCRSLLLCSSQITIAAIGANAAAGGLMLGLGADIAVARRDVVLTPSYSPMGLTGSELHSYTLPRRVGRRTAIELLSEPAPIDADSAAAIGLVDQVGPGDDFDEWVADLATRTAAPPVWNKQISDKSVRLTMDFSHNPLSAYEFAELGEMSHDIFGDRRGFDSKRAALMFKRSSSPRTYHRAVHPPKAASPRR
ncbi:enoyl-CoA hydratase-related protein [Nocardia sp. NPDC060249]|uniref:enoyl-CoA hydratase-related protein n=1 Tax=Nocardia sp. NPDC060249 TaxID=3347082 RepID=UPI00364F8F08